jgi:hypothetical protein
MDGRIALLGRPRIECRGRAVPLAGRKPWGLLAYLCLEHQATRHDLAALLFSAADDPLAALRWSLLHGSCSRAAGSAPRSPRRTPGPRRPWPPPPPTPRWT